MLLTESNKCVFICYPRGGSGKFLINCLAITEYFQPQLTYSDYRKIIKNKSFADFVIEKLNEAIESKEVWNDLDMGDDQFFMTTNILDHEIITESYVKNYQNFIEENLFYLKVNKKYFFRVIHRMAQFDNYKKIWTNPTIIKFINCDTWIDLRNKKKLNKKDYLVKESVGDIEYNLAFDANSLLTYENFIQEFVKVLNYFNVDLVNENKIKEFYSIYRNYII